MIDLYLGNVLDVLAQMPSESVHCIVTSPPYWGLRAYGTEPQVWRNGSEPCQEHEWGEELPHPKRDNRTPSEMASKSSIGRDRCAGGMFAPKANPNNSVFDNSHKAQSQGVICTRCGAWRGELGLEPQPEMFVEHIVAVMREARRVLRADGTLWLNIGDSYAGSGGHSPDSPASQPEAVKARGGFGVFDGRLIKGKNYTGNGLKPKDLVGIPWRVAFALQADGWYLRSDIIWHKPNPMPESVRDRPTKAHEYLFLLAKQPRYYYDADAVREPLKDDPETYLKKLGKRAIEGGTYQEVGKGRKTNGFNTYKTNGTWTVPAGRNRRSVWTVTTHPYSGAHFATFPPKLIEPCILAATSERGVCSKCGAPWVRVVERSVIPEHRKRPEKASGPKGLDTSNGWGDTPRASISVDTLGWRASCDCDAGEPVPATVLDPFNGAGTTGLVALQHGRRYIGIDLKQEYLDMTRARLEKAQLTMVTV